VHAKRAIIASATFTVTVLALTLSVLSGFWSVAAMQTAIGACEAVFGPAISAISLGIVDHHQFARRNGRNEAFNRADNVFAGGACCCRRNSRSASQTAQAGAGHNDRDRARSDWPT
jgi:hypothetical protein